MESTLLGAAREIPGLDFHYKGIAMSSTLASSNRQGVKAKRIPTALTGTIMWTLLDRTRPIFRCQGGKTGGLAKGDDSRQACFHPVTCHKSEYSVLSKSHCGFIQDDISRRSRLNGVKPL